MTARFDFRGAYAAAGYHLTATKATALDTCLHLVVNAACGRKPVGGPDGYYPLSADRISAIAGSDLGPWACQEWQRLGMVDCDGRARAGIRYNGYRLTDDGKRFLCHSPALVPAPDRVAARLGTVRQREIDAAIADGPHGATYADMLTVIRTNLTFAPHFPGMLTNYFRTKLGQLNPAAVVNAGVTVHDLARRQPWLTVSPDSGRCFHSVAGMPRDLRGGLLLDGEPTGEADIGASQWFFLGCVVYGSTPSDERRRYFDMVLADKPADFYAQLAVMAGTPDKSRDAMKTAGLTELLFGPPRYRGKLWAAFARDFPAITAWLESVQRQEGMGQPSRAMLLQKTEADLIYGRVLPRLREYGVKGVSIHDGIMAKAGDLKKVRLVMVGECIAAHGIVTGRVKTSHCGAGQNQPP